MERSDSEQSKIKRGGHKTGKAQVPDPDSKGQSRDKLGEAQSQTSRCSESEQRDKPIKFPISRS